MGFKTYTPDKILLVLKLKRMRREEHVASIGFGRGAYRRLLEKLEGKRPLERPRHRCEENITIDLQNAG
jgi:hypothetical protein